MDTLDQLVAALGAILFVSIAACVIAHFWEPFRPMALDADGTPWIDPVDDGGDPFADVMPADPADAGWLSDPDDEIAAFYRREQHTRGGDV